ncbi:MAG: hypothetical protein HY327_06210 [Chloroflexi bacterium]|nr:hypothetical protein [Chloroflexota bacterium]
MAQDNPNDTLQVEEPQTSTQVPDGATPTEQSVEQGANALSAEPIIVDGAGDTDALRTDDAEDEIPAAELEESEDGDGAASAPEPASNANDVATSLQANAPSAKSEEETDERCEIEKQAYDFDHCTVQIALQLLPADDNPSGRMVVIGVRSHLDTPILRVARWNELGVLPSLVMTLLDELKAELPAREQAAREAIEKKKEEKAKRKSVVTASKTARGKKAKATTLSTSPTSNANVADNRPRPEAPATTAPQQQIGLF